jgi:ataxia telangiectasia mutated family protein
MSEAFDDEAPIKFSSLWFANFDDEVVKEKLIQQALGRIPSRKFIFLAVSHQFRLSYSRTHSLSSTN